MRQSVTRRGGGVVDLEVAQRLVVALGLGLLVGFQREWTAPHVAGIRTFALITLLGAVLALLQDEVGAWLIVAGLVAVAAMLVVGYVIKFSGARDEPGLTTQLAAVVMYTAGVSVGLGRIDLGVILGGSTAVLLHWKAPIHTFVQRMGESDVRAIIQLVLIALVILPVLPNESYDRYGVVNPFEIWLMVVLIVGISLGGYIAYKFLGARAGTLLSGLLGGMISSTATTVGYARRSRQAPAASRMAAVVIVVASTVVFLRVAVEVAVVAPEILGDILPPLAAMMFLMVLISAGLYFTSRQEMDRGHLDEQPSELMAAIVFGLLYAAVLFSVAAVKEHFGDEALYVVAALSGLTDMDAITLSTAQLIKTGTLATETGWRMMLVGALANLVFKAGAVALLGHRQLLGRIATAFGLALAGGVLILIYWP